MASKNTKNFKKPTSSESIAPFNRCSQIKSLLSLLRRPHPYPSSSSNLLTPVNNYTQLTPSCEYKNRLKQLEQELDSLKQRVVNGGAKKEEISSPPSMKKCLFAEDREEDIVRLRDGSLLHDVTGVWVRAGKRMEGLCMHVSQPTVADDSATASEILDRMISMKISDLCKCLMNLMPMSEIFGLDPKTLTSSTIQRDSSTEFFVDSILFNSLRKLEGLILEGLSIQMEYANSSATNCSNITRPTENRNERVVIVALIQARDPKEKLIPIGELMIGIIEAQVENGDQNIRVDGVTVAGLNFARKKIDGRNFMWSVSSKYCDGSDESNLFVRNQDRLFAF